VFDPTSGQPVLWYEGTGTALTNVRYFGQDERGSVISVSDSSANSLGLNSYDEYGKPGASNLGRFQYTGQKWIGEAGLYDYKARDYLPHLGIFAQTDPVGCKTRSNLYAYVSDDPMNKIDPLGLSPTEIIIIAPQNPNEPPHDFGPGSGAFSGGGTTAGGSDDPDGGRGDIVITGVRRPASPTTPPGNPAPTPTTGPGGEIVITGVRRGITVTGRRPSGLPAAPLFILASEQIGRRDNNCKAAAYECLSRNPASDHQACMDMESSCYAASGRMSRVANDEKIGDIRYCVGVVCVTVYPGGIVGPPTNPAGIPYPY
jgi:RHS repeat-associated protein